MVSNALAVVVRLTLAAVMLLLSTTNWLPPTLRELPLARPLPPSALAIPTMFPA